MRKMFLGALAGLVLPLAAVAAGSEFPVAPVTVTEWKPVFGRIESRDTIPARARLGGTLVSLAVQEGETVVQGQVIATIHDEKLALREQSVVAQIDALKSQLDNARIELKRGEDLLQRGVTTAQRLDALRTEVSVLENRIDGVEAEKRVIEQQVAEGAVLAPIAGRVLSVPVTSGAVVMPGEVMATIGGGGFYLRLAVPERHAAHLQEGMELQIGDEEEPRPGQLAKLYPLIENGRVIADVDVAGLNSDFVNARVLVRLPVGTRSALMVPADMVESRMGLDFITIRGGDSSAVARSVVLGTRQQIDGAEMVEVLSGLNAGDIAVSDDD